MDFFETPTWDGDHGSEKLTDDLFRSPNVQLKNSKKRKRNKYPKGAVINGYSKVPDSTKERKTAKVKKNIKHRSGEISLLQPHSLISKGKKLKDVIQQTKERGRSNDIQKDSINLSSSQSSNIVDSLHSISLSNSTLSSKLPKLKKKKKRQSDIEFEGDIDNLKSGHSLKTVKNKLDLNVKVKSHDAGIYQGTSTLADDQKKEKTARYFIKQIHGNLSQATKSLQKKTLNLNRDQACDQLPSYPKNKKNEKAILPKKNKSSQSKIRDTTKLSQVVIHSRRKQSKSESLDNQSSSSLTQKILSDGSGKKKKKKDRGNTCGNSNALTLCKETSSCFLGNPSAIIGKKRKHSEKHEPSPKRLKKLRKGSDVQLDHDILSNEISSSKEKVVQHLTKDIGHVAGGESSSSSQKVGAASNTKKKLTLREKMMEKLRGSRFRFLNEQMYSSKSAETGKFFQIDPEAFEAYHEGYNQQLSQWPVKPVEMIIKYLKKKPSNCIIADFGCGDAQIAQSLPNQVHSFDHVALNDHVTVCDMAHTPLSNGSVDIAVFCLSLMGSNLSDYIYEANRVLKIGGILKIAEVESRFDDAEKFIRVICKFGFLCITRDLSKDVFYLFDFKKERNLKDGKTLPTVELRPCSYKKR